MPAVPPRAIISRWRLFPGGGSERPRVSEMLERFERAEPSSAWLGAAFIANVGATGAGAGVGIGMAGDEIARRSGLPMSSFTAEWLSRSRT